MKRDEIIPTLRRFKEVNNKDRYEISIVSRVIRYCAKGKGIFHKELRN